MLLSFLEGKAGTSGCEMIESSRTKRSVWILSLTLGPVLFCILLLTLPGAASIEAIKNSLIDLVEALAIFWAAGFAFVWIAYWSGKFFVKYGPFM